MIDSKYWLKVVWIFHINVCSQFKLIGDTFPYDIILHFLFTQGHSQLLQVAANAEESDDPTLQPEHG